MASGNQGHGSAGQFTWQCQCGQRYRSTMDDIGKTAQCRKCGTKIVVPRPPTPQKNPSSPTHASAKPPAPTIEKREETPAGEPTSSSVADDAAKAAPPAKKDDYTILGLFLLALLAVNSAIVSSGGRWGIDDIAIAVLPVILFAVLAHRILLKGMRGLPEGIEKEGNLRKLYKWFLPAFWAYAFVGAGIVYLAHPSLMWGAVMFGLPAVAFEAYILSQSKSPRLYLVPMIAVGSAGGVMILACYVRGYGWVLPLVLCLVGAGILHMPFGKWGAVSRESDHKTWIRRVFPSRNDCLLLAGCLVLGLVGVALDWFGVVWYAFWLLPAALTVVVFHAVKPFKPLHGTNAKVSYVVLVVVAALWISHEGYWRVESAARRASVIRNAERIMEENRDDAEALSSLAISLMVYEKHDLAAEAYLRSVQAKMRSYHNPKLYRDLGINMLTKYAKETGSDAYTMAAERLQKVAAENGVAPTTENRFGEDEAKAALEDYLKAWCFGEKNGYTRADVINPNNLSFSPTPQSYQIDLTRYNSFLKEWEIRVTCKFRTRIGLKDVPLTFNVGKKDSGRVSIVTRDIVE